METSAHVQPCLDCHRACTEAVTNLLHGRISPGYDESVYLVVLLDCAHICVVCADFMTRGSVHHKHVCRVCDEICEGCAVLCEKCPDPDDIFSAPPKYADAALPPAARQVVTTASSRPSLAGMLH